MDISGLISKRVNKHMFFHKIAIFTYWESSDNYGQILQCFALQKYLRDRGHDAYLVKYSPDEMRPNRIVKLKNVIRKINRIIHLKSYLSAKKFQKEEQVLKNINEQKNQKRGFELFREQYIKSSKHIYRSIDELINNPPDADIYICGSDQVWRDCLNQNNVAGWYLQFGDDHIVRLSFAASIGRKITPDENNIFKVYLSKFKAISLREKSTMEYCKKVGIQNVEMVCDPTLLLTSDCYRNVFKSHSNKFDKPYVFFYTINLLSKDDLYWDDIYGEIKKRNWGVKSVSSSGYFQARNIVPVHDDILATIPEWLELIQNASFVITSSFHGMVFCILFHKPFVVIPLRGIHENANERLISLLNDVGLDVLLCFSKNDVISALDYKIDWNLVDEKLRDLRRKGELFLERNIELV